MTDRPMCSKHQRKPEFGCAECAANARRWLCWCGDWREQQWSYCSICLRKRPTRARLDSALPEAERDEGQMTLGLTPADTSGNALGGT